ncbi:6-phosphogluconolactonase [uncultured Maribacter sp.]|uniref:6-phosphogluconolactonase n=1 Tax=uncultured Maribacter sp. TaxID=431308 RepID=UPI0026262E9C|nr:6-phosphogluconolactonase [uncultured Maribacter sp.]
MKLNIYNTKEEVAIRFSTYFSNLIGKKKNLHIALSGGSTPKIVFDELATNFLEIDWSGVHLYWGDERCVSPSDNESNYKMTVSHLISKINIPEENIHRVLGENEPLKEAVRYSNLLDALLPRENNFPKFDLVVLGMGDDGHTASIFPHEIHLWNSENNCEVAVHPDSGQKRITITGRVINNAKEVVFLVTGENKKDKVTEILNKNGSYTDYPASLVAPKSEKLIWFLDVDAAQKIDV